MASAKSSEFLDLPELSDPPESRDTNSVMVIIKYKGGKVLLKVVSFRGRFLVEYISPSKLFPSISYNAVMQKFGAIDTSGVSPVSSPFKWKRKLSEINPWSTFEEGFKADVIYLPGDVVLYPIHVRLFTLLRHNCGKRLAMAITTNKRLFQHITSSTIPYPINKLTRNIMEMSSPKEICCFHKKELHLKLFQGKICYVYVDNVMKYINSLTSHRCVVRTRPKPGKGYVICLEF